MRQSKAEVSLHAALRLARTKRWVNDFLFTALDNPFHANLTLPPSHFESAIGWHWKQIMSLHLVGSPEVAHELDYVLIPVASVENVIVGYTFGTKSGKPTCNNSFFHEDNPFQEPYVGRFAYDANVQELLQVTKRGPIGLQFMAVRKYGTDCCAFVVPGDEYGFEKLPDKVMAMYYAAEYKVDSTPDMKSDLVPAVAGLLPEKDKLDVLPSNAESDKSYLPWIVDGKGALADGGSISFCPEQTEIASGAFGFQLLLGLRELQKTRCGNFYIPTSRMDIMQEPGMGLLSIYTGEGCFKAGQLFGDGIGRLKQAFATTFFGAVLGVEGDQRLLTADEDEAVTDKDVAFACSDGLVIGGEVNLTQESFAIQNGHAENSIQAHVCVDGDLHSVALNYTPLERVPRRRRQKKQVGPRVAPLIAPKYPIESDLEKPPPTEDESKAEEHARVVYERRRRNRLSAARSNAKKKQELEAMKREITSNRERVKQLEGRKSALADENERLRHIAGTLDTWG